MKDFEPQIVGFLCNWCSYAGADLAGTSRMEYPPNIRIIRVPCSGRMNPLFVIKCLMHGADGVLISGCHINDCHYSDGNFYARRRFAVLKKLLEYLGVDPRRFQMSWVSASEGDKWTKVVKELTEEIRQAGPSKLADSA
ncbi:MAG: hydrogenase iron-sulfur subunit [Candidatus Omnitrophota bacterium]|nr:hydrogenase iron-sulfur subunit [Candidatus Omnitrophota bacterium]